MKKAQYEKVDQGGHWPAQPFSGIWLVLGNRRVPCNSMGIVGGKKVISKIRDLRPSKLWPSTSGCSTGTSASHLYPPQKYNQKAKVVQIIPKSNSIHLFWSPNNPGLRSTYSLLSGSGHEQGQGHLKPEELREVSTKSYFYTMLLQNNIC